MSDAGAPDQGLTLGIEVCLGQCAAALIRGGDVIAARAEPMERGHAEALPPMVRDVLQQASAVPGDISLIGVTCGPGSFTGARLGVAFARGLSLATGCRAIGLSTLELLAAEQPEGRVLAAVDGRRGEVFAQLFQDGHAAGEAMAIRLEPEAVAQAIAEAAPQLLIGPGAGLLSNIAPGVIDARCADSRPDAASVARLAAQSPAQLPPRPIYLRAPDAKLPAAGS